MDLACLPDHEGIGRSSGTVPLGLSEGSPYEAATPVAPVKKNICPARLCVKQERCGRAPKGAKCSARIQRPPRPSSSPSPCNANKATNRGL